MNMIIFIKIKVSCNFNVYWKQIKNLQDYLIKNKEIKHRNKEGRVRAEKKWIKKNKIVLFC